MTWPHRNPPQQIAERQARLRALPNWDPRDDFVFEWPRSPAEFAPLIESLTAHVALPVSVVGPLRVELGRYETAASGGRLNEIGRAAEELFVPLAHSEGGLAASLQRGMLAIADTGLYVRTYVLRDRMTRASCFAFDSTREAVTFANWIAAHVDDMRAWLHDDSNPGYAAPVGGIAQLSRHARLWEVETHVIGSTCHVLYRYSTGEACGLNLVTRNSFALNSAYVAPRFEVETGMRARRVLLEANMGGDKKPSAPYFVDGGHGKTVVAEVDVPERTLKSILRSSSADLVALEHLGLHGSHASQMQSVAFTPASIVAAIFAATGQDLGMVGTSSMAHVVLEPTARVPATEDDKRPATVQRTASTDRLARPGDDRTGVDRSIASDLTGVPSGAENSRRRRGGPRTRQLSTEHSTAAAASNVGPDEGQGVGGAGPRVDSATPSRRTGTVDEGGVHLSIRFSGIEVGTVGGGTGMPHARAFLSLLGCQGTGSAQRLAQIVAATALCLELSAAASAATPFSENFARAHAGTRARPSTPHNADATT